MSSLDLPSSATELPCISDGEAALDELQTGDLLLYCTTSCGARFNQARARARMRKRVLCGGSPLQTRRFHWRVYVCACYLSEESKG